MSFEFRRTLPARPDLAQQKTQARELLRSFTAGDAEAVSRIRAALPDKREIVLADAQFTLAREYGFESWSALKQHIDQETADRRTPFQRMHDAFARHDAEEIRRLLRRYPEFRQQIDSPGAAFDSPAIVAYAGDAAIVQVLLEAGADPNRRSEWWAGGFHALHSATAESAELLLAAGAVPDACAAAHLDRPDLLRQMLAEDPARVHERGGDGQTPLHFAESREVADLLLDAGADIDARDVDHRATPAQWMLAKERDAGRYELARHLVERGASADIFLAAALGLTRQAGEILRKDPAAITLRTGAGEYGEQPPSSYHIYFWTIGPNRSPLEVAAQFGHRDTFAAMLEVAPLAERLLLACRRGDADAAREIARSHPGLIDSLPPAQQRALPDAAWDGNEHAVALMLELGFDPRTPGHDSGTALHISAWEGSPRMTAALLRHPDARELIAIREPHHGGTPLGWCCYGSLHNATAFRDFAAVAQMLLAAGAALEPGLEAAPAVEVVLASARAARGHSAGR